MNKPGKPRNLRSPQETWTDKSAVLIWDKPADPNGIASYDIYMDGICIATTKQTCYKAVNLSSQFLYAFSIVSKDNNGNESESSEAVTVSTSAESLLIDVTRAPYYAVGDGGALATANIQQAIDDCPPGGTVYIPEGVFVTSGLFLKSDMTLRLDGTLLGSMNLDDYPYVTYRFGPFRPFRASMINIGSLEGPLVRNVRIEGSGTVNGNGEALRPLFFAAAPDASYSERNSNFTCINCENIYVEGISFRNSACWSVHPILTDHITFYNISLNNFDYKVINGDGINPDACRHVNILNSRIDSQDDNVSIKNGMSDDSKYDHLQRPCEDILISDCVFKGGLGFSPGLESYYGVRRVTMRDCVFHNSASLFHPICCRGVFAHEDGVMGKAHGGIIEDIVVRDIQYYNDLHRDNMWIRAPIDINMYYTAGPLDNPDFITWNPIDEFTPHIRNLTIENIVIVDKSDRHAVMIRGLPESKIKNVTIKHVYASAKLGLAAINAEDIRVEDVRIEPAEGEPFSWIQTDRVEERLNVIANPGFERGNVDWLLRDTRIVHEEAWPNQRDVHRGKYTLKLNSVHSLARQEITEGLLQGEQYIFSAYGKVSDIGLIGYAKAIPCDSEGDRIDGAEAVLSFAANDYILNRTSIVLPEHTSQIVIEVYFVASEHAYDRSAIRTDKYRGSAFFVDDFSFYAGHGGKSR